MPREAIVIGLGLIGGSVAKALRAREWRVRYRDRAHVTDDFEIARELDADVIVLATPVDAAASWLRGNDAPLVTSVCSVMRPLRAAARGTFVAGHPLAGSENVGYEHSRAELFAGRKWFVDAREPVVDELVRDCGAELIEVTADEHDRALALTSHIPQALSTALATYLEQQQIDVQKFAGTGLATFLRLASSDASVWTPVLDANRDNIAPHLEQILELARDLNANAFENAQKLAQKLKS